MPAYDGWTPATLMSVAAAELETHGHAGEAQAARRRGIGWLASRPAKEQASEAHRFVLAQLYYRENRLSEAEHCFEAWPQNTPTASATPATLACWRRSGVIPWRPIGSPAGSIRSSGRTWVD